MKILSCLSFAVVFLCALPVWAQQPPVAAPAPIASPPVSGGWGDEAFERQDLREEMEQIRKEHEEIENATDELLDRCVKPGAHIDACEKEKQDLKDRRQRLHDRRLALRDKIEADRRARAAMPHGMVPLSQPAAPIGSSMAPIIYAPLIAAPAIPAVMPEPVH